MHTSFLDRSLYVIVTDRLRVQNMRLGHWKTRREADVPKADWL